MISILLTLGLGVQGMLAAALQPPLSFSRDGVFKVALFTDLHYGESPELDLKSNEVV
jgi:hypothetical protein